MANCFSATLTQKLRFPDEESCPEDLKIPYNPREQPSLELTCEKIGVYGE